MLVIYNITVRLHIKFILWGGSSRGI